MKKFAAAVSILVATITSVVALAAGGINPAPSGPPAPAGGWQVVYADQFNDCLTAIGAVCLTGAPRDDSTVTASTGHAESSNQMNVYNPDHVAIGPDGLELSCTYTPNIATAKNYTCGEVRSVFNFEPGQGQEWAIETVFQAPPNTGEMDPASWAIGARWAWEIDGPEQWGMRKGSGGLGWCAGAGDLMGFPAIPRSNFGGASGQGDAQTCLNGDPSLALHTYTVVMNGTTFSAYLDGKPVKWTYGTHTGQTSFSVGSVGSWSKTMGCLIIGNDLRSVNFNPSPYFKSGSRTLVVRSIAVYENASANGANTLHDAIAPGTSIG